MRTSILARSVIAIASLAIGSAALVAAPATAATSSGVTREMVLTLTKDVRAAKAANVAYPFMVGRTINRMASRVCDFHFDRGNWHLGWSIEAINAGSSVDGVLISIRLSDAADDKQEFPVRRQCTFAALTTTDARFALSGNATITALSQTPSAGSGPAATLTTVKSALADDVFVTEPLDGLPPSTFVSATFSSTGNATRPVNVTTNVKVAISKSAAVKKAAKNAYDKKLKTAKKTYTKALKKAGKSKKIKAAAKKVYNKKKATAKTAYTKAIATTFKIVPRTIASAENRPFSVTTAVAAYVPVPVD